MRHLGARRRGRWLRRVRLRRGVWKGACEGDGDDVVMMTMMMAMIMMMMIIKEGYRCVRSW